MRRDIQDIADIQAFLNADVSRINDRIAANPGASRKITGDESSALDDRKDCATSILHHIKGLEDITDNSEYTNRVAAIQACWTIYKTSINYSSAFSEIRKIIFADLEGEYTPDFKPQHTRSLEQPKAAKQEAFNPRKAQSEPQPRKSADMPSTGLLRKFSLHREQQPEQQLKKKVLKCDLIAVTAAPTKESLETLPVNSQRAYVRFENDLYYINKFRNSCVKLDIDADTLARFDARMQPDREVKLLSRAQLDDIASIIGKKGHNAKPDQKSPDITPYSPK